MISSHRCFWLVVDTYLVEVVLHNLSFVVGIDLVVRHILDLVMVVHHILDLVGIGLVVLHILDLVQRCRSRRRQSLLLDHHFLDIHHLDHVRSEKITHRKLVAVLVRL